MVWNAFTDGARWDPWRDLHQVHTQLNRLFSDFTSSGASEFPPVELWTGESGLVLRARLPGLSPEDIELTVVGDTLTLKGSRPAPETSAAESYRRRERASGKFLRTIRLPIAVESEQIRARFEKGVLEVTLPRAASERPHKIHVQST
jgi:HSP20 family protein